MPAKRKKKKNGKTIALLILCGVMVAACALITVSERLPKPFLPTWHQLYVMAGLSAPPLPEGTLQVHVIDVGNADSIFLRTEQATLLIDAGERNDEDIVINYLHGQGVKKLDYVIATHADADHIGGMSKVVSTFDIGTFLMPAFSKTPTTATYIRLLETLKAKQLKITTAKPDLSYALNEAKLDILAPIGEGEGNNQSVVCKVTFGKTKFLFMGDAEKEAEQALLDAKTDVSADFIKIGHHGSNSSTTAAFLKAVNPRYATIGCGADNPYGHPHQKALDRLIRMNIAYYRSDVCGNIVAASDGSAITITTQKGD